MLLANICHVIVHYVRYLSAPFVIADTLLTKAKRYLLDTLGSEACAGDWGSPWPEAESLPFYLQGPYSYSMGELFGRPCLLMLVRGPRGETPGLVRKHWELVSQRFDGDVIYTAEAIASYNRNRLIVQRVPFLVPGNQLFLPPLGVDLREYFRPGRQAEVTHLSPAAQVVLLREILHRDCSGMPAKDLAGMLGYSSMTITRAINELTSLELAMAIKAGREKHLRFELSGRSLWDAARPVLRSPVTKRVRVVVRGRGPFGTATMGPIAGESALAHYTDIADAAISQRTITSEALAALARSQDVHVLATQADYKRTYLREDRDVIELELWAYNPDAISDGEPWVDPLSLWLSLESCGDERIEMACEALLEQVWSAL